MATQDLRRVYYHIIDDVVAKMKPEFVQESVDESVLHTIRQRWAQKLSERGILTEETEEAPKKEDPLPSRKRPLEGSGGPAARQPRPADGNTPAAATQPQPPQPLPRPPAPIQNSQLPTAVKVEPPGQQGQLQQSAPVRPQHGLLAGAPVGGSLLQAGGPAGQLQPPAQRPPSLMLHPQLLQHSLPLGQQGVRPLQQAAHGLLPGGLAHGLQPQPGLQLPTPTLQRSQALAVLQSQGLLQRLPGTAAALQPGLLPAGTQLQQPGMQAQMAQLAAAVAQQPRQQQQQQLLHVANLPSGPLAGPARPQGQLNPALLQQLLLQQQRQQQQQPRVPQQDGACDEDDQQAVLLQPASEPLTLSGAAAAAGMSTKQLRALLPPGMARLLSARDAATPAAAPDCVVERARVSVTPACVSDNTAPGPRATLLRRRRPPSPGRRCPAQSLRRRRRRCTSPSGATEGTLCAPSAPRQRRQCVPQIDGLEDEYDDDADDDDAAAGDEEEEEDDEAAEDAGADEDEDDEDDDDDDDHAADIAKLDDDLDAAEEADREEIPDVGFALYEKVHRSKNRWRCSLRFGVFFINGREYMFNKASTDLTF